MIRAWWLKKKIIRSIFIAKGICMILVVAGHYRPVLEPDYWVTFYSVRHQFTMPLFFMLSGFLFRYVSSADTGNYYKVFFTRKVHRLVYPYLVISLLYFTVKLFAGLFFDLQHPADAESLLYILLNPLRGSSTLLWFMYTLILVFIVYPALKALLRNDLLVFAVTVGMMYIPLTDYFCLNPLASHLPFFVFGTLLSGRVDFDELSIRKNILVILAGTLLFVPTYIFRGSIDLRLARLVMGVSGTMTVVSISSLLTRPEGNIAGRLFETIGFYSMSIYLLHTLILGTIRILKYQILDIDAFFFLGAAVAILSATVILLLLEKNVLRKIRLTRKYILGLK